MKKSWFENASFWKDYAPVLFDENRWAEAHGVAQEVLHLANLKKGNSVLDAGCGPGRILVELALLGMNVTGVDLMDFYLEAAKETAQDEDVFVNLIQADLRNFFTEQTFDCALNLYTSIGYCDTILEDMQILQNIAKSVKKGGTFILETTSRETAILNFTEGEIFERSGITVETHFEVSGAWEGLRSKWNLLFPDGKKISHEFTQRLYSAVELKNMVLQSGFSSVKIYGGFDKRPYNQNAKTLVIVAQK